jgi:hypothetical protein
MHVRVDIQSRNPFDGVDRENIRGEARQTNNLLTIRIAGRGIMKRWISQAPPPNTRKL